MLRAHLNDKQGKGSIILVIIVTVAIAASAFLLIKRSSNFGVHKKDKIEVGKPCAVADVEKLTERGWQCYLYGEAGLNRKGIWITPEVRTPNYETLSSETIYKDFLAGWKTFRSPDNIFSFRYPRAWEVNTLNWKEFHSIEIFTDPGDLNSAIKIEALDNKGVNGSMISMDEEIQRLESASSVIEQTPIDLNGSPAVIIRTAPKITTDYEYTHLFVPKDKYFVHAFVVSSPRDTFYEFPRRLLLSTLKVK